MCLLFIKIKCKCYVCESSLYLFALGKVILPPPQISKNFVLIPPSKILIFIPSTLKFLWVNLNSLYLKNLFRIYLLVKILGDAYKVLERRPPSYKMKLKHSFLVISKACTNRLFVTHISSWCEFIFKNLNLATDCSFQRPIVLWPIVRVSLMQR